jgi:hypothetical protein
MWNGRPHASGKGDVHTPVRSSTPSSSVRNAFTTRSVTPELSLPLQYAHHQVMTQPTELQLAIRNPVKKEQPKGVGFTDGAQWSQTRRRIEYMAALPWPPTSIICG